MRFMIYGFGIVAQSLIKILIKENIAEMSDILIAECNEKNIEEFLRLGGNKENILNITVKRDNMSELFDRLRENDFLIALCGDTDYVYLLEESVKRKIHFVSAADGAFPENRDDNVPEPVANIRKYKAIREKYRMFSDIGAVPTCVLEFGMNPGMISIFTKRALEDIVAKDSGDFVKKNRSSLEKLIREKKYAELSYRLKVRKIMLSDYDNLTFSVPYKDGKKYSPWNISGMFEEFLGNSTEILGSFDSPKGWDFCYYDRETGYIKYNSHSIVNEKEGLAPSGTFSGFLMNHEELLTLSEYYSFYDESGLIYRPGIRFIYKPNDYTVRSGMRIYETGEDLEDYLLTGDMILANGEAVGVLLEGDNFSPIYVGNYLDKKDVGNESPTILQVSASMYAAIAYILNHPYSGVLFAEEPDTSEMMDCAKKYLIDFTETVKEKRG